MPARGDARGMADAVVEAAGGSLERMRVLAPRADGGRDEGIEAMRAAGAEVEAVSVYRSEVAEPDEPSVRHGLARLRAGEIDAVAVFAPSQVRAVFELVGERCAEILARCGAIAAIGATTKRELERRGVPVSVVPGEPSADALASALAAFFDPSAEAEC